MPTAASSSTAAKTMVKQSEVMVVVVGGRLACCNLSWLHTRWWFSLVPDPIIYAPCSVLLKGKGVNLFQPGCGNAKGLETAATERAWDDQLGTQILENLWKMNTRRDRTDHMTGASELFVCSFSHDLNVDSWNGQKKPRHLLRNITARSVFFVQSRAFWTR